MEFMLLFTGPQGSPDPDPGGFAEMKRYSGELASQHVLRCGAPLESSRCQRAGARRRGHS